MESSSKTNFRNRPAHMIFPEDLDCVLEAADGKGGIYIGNLEAAENLQTLKSNSLYIQNTTSNLY